MKVYQLTYTAQVAAVDTFTFKNLSEDIEIFLTNEYSGNIIVDNSRTELENDSEIITS